MRKALSSLFSEEELKKAITSIDIIGDIAIIKIPREWENKKYEIGEALLSHLGGVKGVFRQISPASGEYKVRGIEWLAGKKDTVTIHKEHNCLFKVDISKVFFSPRLSFERLRIAKLVKKGEIVVNMFAGVGTFSILIAKSGAQKVYSIDKNPYAFELMCENIKLNKLEGIVIPILGDAKDVVKDLKGIADRVLLPFPELAIEYLPYAIECLKEQGWLHVYLHQKANNRKEAIEEAKKLLKDFNIINERVVRSVGKKLYQVVLDIEIRKNAKST
ncbi:MAG: class I SAM-dependent methyltransferase family protein [Candidatus Verstraetearchaeota archaeon]|nr:class I SAM-dependent methyltransferase family protein [Candidatus Verstraetearchaeota archaeon]